MASMLFDEILFNGHPYSRPEDGYPETIQKITRNDLAGYVRKYIIGKPHVTALLLSPADRTKLGVTPAQLMDGGAQ